MKSFIYLFCLFFILGGCSSLTMSQVASTNRDKLSKLDLGMKKNRALKVMGSKTKTPVCVPEETGKKQKVIITNPYSNEIIHTPERILEVYYFFTDPSNECVVEKKQLTPLVFDNEKLIGWGRDFMTQTKSRIEQ